MAVITISDRRLQDARVRIIAMSSLMLLYAYSGLISLARAEDPGDQPIVDVSLLTCGDFVGLSLPRALIAVGWVGGFYAGLKKDTRVDIPLFVDRAEQVIAFCHDNKSMRLMTVVEQELRRDHEHVPFHSPSPPSSGDHGSRK